MYDTQSEYKIEHGIGKRSGMCQDKNEKKCDKDNLETSTNLGIISKSDNINRCIECGIDMGNSNPRQFCRKTYCENT